MIRILSQTVPDAVRGAVQALNDRDSEAFQDCFHTHAVIDDWGHRIVGVDAIGDWCVEQFTRPAVTLSNAMFVNESPVRTAMRVRVGAGEAETPRTFTFDVDGERIARLRITA